MSGRKQDIVWNYFDKLTNADKKGCRAKCKSCGKELQGLVCRLKLHVTKCTRNEDEQEDQTTLNIQEDSHRTEKLQDVVIQAKTASTSSGTKEDGTFSSAISNVSFFSNKRQLYQNPSASKKTCRVIELQSQSQSISKFLVKTSNSEKNLLDHQIARYVFATNTPFNSVEHPEFKKMITMLRPGYTAPNRKQISGPLLDSVYNTVQADRKEQLENKVVCMALDGWSNVHNEPIVCMSVSAPTDKSVFIVDTIDTSGNKHTAEYLHKLAQESIKSCENLFGCKVRSFVTDNAANVTKMRAELLLDENVNLITYGCSAHILNLLAHDVEIKGVKDHVTQIMKYFRNVHMASARYREAGGQALILPLDVRWNSLADCLECFIKNWPVMVKVCEENRNDMSEEIVNKVNNIAIKRNAEDYLARLKPISVAIDRMQRTGSTISDAVQIWKVLLIDLQDGNQPKDVLKMATDREKMALTPAHFLANLLDPKYKAKRLANKEIESAMEFCLEKYPALVPILINYRAITSPFTNYMFSKTVVESVEPLSWWLCFGVNFGEPVLEAVQQLFNCAASTAGIERIFSSFGFVHSKVRNRL